MNASGPIRMSRAESRRDRAPAPRAVFGLCLAALCAAGCPPQQGEVAELRTRVETLSEQTRKQSEELLTREQELRDLRGQVERLTRIGGDGRYELLPKMTKLVIDNRSRGYNSDDRPGSDELRAYIATHDEDGDVVKFVGLVQAQVVDLANPPTQQLVAEARWTPEELRKQWFGRFGFQHYRLILPWGKGGPPRHPSLTLRVVFVDVLTGRRFEEQKVVEVEPPG